MICFGVDPGVSGGGGTGVAQTRDGKVEWVHMVRGTTTPAADWNVTGPALERVARATWTAIEHRLLWVGLTVDDDVPVAVEGYVYQGHRGEGRGDNKHFWKGAAVTGAIAATRPTWATIRWANANDVLRHGGGGYGDLRDYLAAGKARGVDPGRLVRNEHVASAVCHALHMEASARITRLPV